MNQKNIDVLKSLGFELNQTIKDNYFFSFGIYSVRVNGKESNNLILITKKRNFNAPRRDGTEIILFRGFDVFDDKEFAMKLFKKIGFFRYVEKLSNNPDIKERHNIYYKKVKVHNDI